MLHYCKVGEVTMFQLGKPVFGKPLRTVNAFLVGGILVDTGPPSTAGELLAALCNTRLEQAVITHAHEDHAGGAKALNGIGIVPLAAVESLDKLAQPEPLPFYRRLVWGQPGPARVAPLAGTVANGTYELKVLPAPGHSPDHKVLWEPKRGWLFTGDLFMAEKVRFLFREESVRIMVETIDFLLQLDFKTVFCAHRGYIARGRESLAAKRDYLVSLGEEVHKLRRRGLAPEKITSLLLGPPTFLEFFSRGEFSKLNLVRSLLSDPPRSTAR